MITAWANVGYELPQRKGRGWSGSEPYSPPLIARHIAAYLDLGAVVVLVNVRRERPRDMDPEGWRLQPWPSNGGRS